MKKVSFSLTFTHFLLNVEGGVRQSSHRKMDFYKNLFKIHKFTKNLYVF